MIRGAKAVAQVKQGQWLNCESVEKRNLSWRDLWNMEESCIRFLKGTRCDVLLTPQILKLSVNGNPSCLLCSDIAKVPKRGPRGVLSCMS